MEQQTNPTSVIETAQELPMFHFPRSVYPDNGNIVLLKHPLYTVDRDVTFETSVRIFDGVQFEVDGGVTLRFDNTVTLDGAVIFTGRGQVVFTAEQITGLFDTRNQEGARTA